MCPVSTGGRAGVGAQLACRSGFVSACCPCQRPAARRLRACCVLSAQAPVPAGGARVGCVCVRVCGEGEMGLQQRER
jgi:hypothetical protein